ncbi:SDR family NAD(P)-dependent oxidoreductase [Streptomyces olivaceoviridis]
MAQGAKVALTAWRKDRLDELVERFKADGGTAFAVETDITYRMQATAMIEQTVAAFGGLDTLVNNAGIMLLGPSENASIEEWDRRSPSTRRACCMPPTLRCRTCSSRPTAPRNRRHRQHQLPGRARPRSHLRRHQPD